MTRLLPSAASFMLIVAAGTSSAADIDYAEHIKPLLMEKCAACHGALKQEGGLRLDAAQLIRTGSDDGPVIAPGDAEGSRLLQRVTATDPAERMPPEGEGEPLNEQQLALLRAWIDAGAPAPDDEPVPPGPGDHWAYQPLSRPDVPRVDDLSSPANPIDAFITAAQQSAGVTPYPPADRLTLLRRVTLDLIGLPPTRDEIRAFLDDDSEAAYERVVDRLLQNPRHGERWARHWMDVWRYSDWDGYQNELRGSQRHIWRWRDWIIESLNADKPYDQMIREMLAADELAPEDQDALRATGFLARNYHNSNRNIWLDATVEHTAKAFLGMTLNCARCHDHKYDPIVQQDYYAFRAIFEPHEVRVERLPGERDLKKDGLPRAFDAKPDAQTYLYIAGNEKQPDKEHPLMPGIPAVFGELPAITSVPLPLSAWFPAAQEFIRREDLAATEARVAAARKELEAILPAGNTSAEPSDAAAGSTPPPPPFAAVFPLEEEGARANLRAAEAALAAWHARWAADEARYLKQDSVAAESLAAEAARRERTANLRQAEADVVAKRQAVEKAREEPDEGKRKTALANAEKQLAAAREALAKAREAMSHSDSAYTSIGPVYPQSSTGRRTALAQWITSRENPLTPRVAVNHIWLRHFGEPLVENVFDFGLRSPRPVHADLLDWLAVEFMDSGWSMKRLHRVIVTSQAYRRASSAETALAAANREIDPDNALLWRMNVRRLDAEIVRDSILAVSGSLDTTTGGPDIDFREGENVPRRSVYFRHAYEKQMTMLVLFDAANPTDCYRRSESIVPQQALTLANSTLSLSESRKLARTLWAECQSSGRGDGDFVRAGFEQVLSRPPMPEEADACLEFLIEQSARLADASLLTEFGGKTEASVAAADDPQMRARENLVHVLMNHNDFVTVR